MANEILSQDNLHEIFEYRAGELYWKTKIGKKIKIGQKAGHFGNLGYFRVSVNKKRYLVHRLIFLMHHGYLPKIIDHIDGNPANNCIKNLRETTNSENLYNSKIRKNNLANVKGVYWHKPTKKWTVRLSVNGKSTYFGLFDDIKLAENVAVEARNKYHGIYARHN